MGVAGYRGTLVTTQDNTQCYNPDSYSAEVSRIINKKIWGENAKDEAVRVR